MFFQDSLRRETICLMKQACQAHVRCFAYHRALDDQKARQKKSYTNFFFKMRQIGRLGSGIVEIGAVKRLISWYGVYK